MKKFTSAALVLALLLSLCMLSSCGKVTAHSLISDAQEKQGALDSYESEVKMDLQLDMGMLGGKITVPFELNTKASGITGENPVSLVSVKIASQTMIFYQEGDWVYTVSDGVGTKSKVDEDTKALSSVFSESYSEDIEELFSEENMKDLDVVENEDGTRSVAMPIPDELLNGMFETMLEEFNKTVSEDSSVEDFDLSIADCVVEFVVDEEGYFSSYTFQCNMSMRIVADETAGGMSISFDVPLDATCTYIHPGAAVTITPPEGYQNFPESGSGSI